jgi:hypothetical protein
MIKNLEKIGGLAALGHSLALVFGMVLSFTLMFPLLNAAPDQALKFLAGNQAIVYLWKLIVEWGAVIPFVIMLLALYVRLKPGAPALTFAAVVFGFLGAGLTIGVSNLMLHHFGVVANLFGSDPAQKMAAWTALVRSLWVLLLSMVAMQTGGLTRAVSYLGVFLGIAEQRDCNRAASSYVLTASQHLTWVIPLEIKDNWKWTTLKVSPADAPDIKSLG